MSDLEWVRKASGESTWEEKPSEGGGSISLLGPFTVDFNTPGFINPENNGIDTLAIPAGSIILDVLPIATSEWVGAGEEDQFVVSVLASPSGSGPTFGRFTLAGTADAPTIALAASYILDSSVQGGSVEAVDWTSQKRPVLAVADCHLVIAGYPVGSVTAGSLDLYAIVIAT